MPSVSPDTEDVFQDNEPVIVDGDVLEAAKENIQPLASGRRATTLSAVLSTPHAQRESKLAATRNRLRINVEIAMEDEDDDPLEAWCRLVYWTVENYPQGHSAESGLLELLEEATRVLKDHREGVFRNDLRYLKLWVLYASYVEKPVVIFRYLLANDIGTAWALFYEEFAIVLERSARRTDADEMYLLGINRQADPLDRLHMKHREFQKRMMSAAPLPEAAPPAATPASTKRKVLGESSTKSSRSTTGSTSSSRAQPDDVFTAGPSTRPRPNARMQIFVDPTGSEAQSAADSSTTPWEELGGRHARIKENIPEVGKMSGSTIKQPGRHQRIASASSSSRIAVFRDTPGAGDMLPPPVPTDKRGKVAVPSTPSRSTTFLPFRDGDGTSTETPSTPKFTPFRDEEATTPSSSGAVPDSVMKVKKAGGKGPFTASEAEALRKDPFKNYIEKPVDVD
ncbi:hypothetical protein DENSPDRAFT_872196 [Dentipellis sp. KUC8613]|nr:hypothetical protein DENSPDRAFT_872196 [Dentipellis sp. KUC8613]